MHALYNYLLQRHSRVEVIYRGGELVCRFENNISRGRTHHPDELICRPDEIIPRLDNIIMFFTCHFRCPYCIRLLKGWAMKQTVFFSTYYGFKWYKILYDKTQLADRLCHFQHAMSDSYFIQQSLN